MIHFKQKEFFAPLAGGAVKALAGAGGGSALGGALNVLGTGVGVAGLVSGNKQANAAAEQQEAMIRQQNKDSKRQAAAINNLAKATQQAAKAGTNVSGIASTNGNAVGKLFSFRPKVQSLVTSGKQVLQDTFNVAKKGKVGSKIAHGLAGGLTMAGLAYGTDKVITHDARKSGLMPEKTEEEKEASKKKRNIRLKKLGIGTLATVGTMALGTAAANKGLLGDKAKGFVQKNIVNTDPAKKGILNNIAKTNIKKAANEVGKGFKEQFNSPLGAALTLGFGVALPSASYLSQKAQLKKQQEQSENNVEEQKQYSAATVLTNLKKNITPKLINIKNRVVNYFKVNGKPHTDNLRKSNSKIKTFLKSPVKKTLSGISNFWGGGGEAGVNKFTSDLAKEASKNNHQATLKVADFLDKHKKTALVGSIAVGSALMKPWSAGNKVGSGVMKAIDSDAYAYEEHNNKTIE